MRKLAYESVARACGFGMLAIVCVMVGMSYDPHAVFKAGGFLTLIMTLILLLKARLALTQNHRKTEMWLYLPVESRPPESHAQWLTATVLRETYLTFAKWTAAITIGLSVLALLVPLALR
jgi:hypothetical protein